MKILHIAAGFAPHIGGVETHVAEVAKLQVAAGHQVTVLTALTDQRSPLEEKIAGVMVVRCPAGMAQARSWRYKVSIWRWMWQQRRYCLATDVIQVHDIFWWLLPFLPAIEDKTFTTFHGWETQFPVRTAAKIQRWLWSWLSVATVHVGAWIQEFYWDKPTVVTYGGAPKPIAESAITPTTKLKKIVFLGRLATDNDVEGYIEIIKQLKQKYSKLEMVWIGDGPLRTVCQKVGKVTGLTADPKTEIKSADVIFASSYLSIWTALSLGKLTASLYSVPLKRRYLETFPAAPVLLISDNPSDLADKIKAVAASPSDNKSRQRQGWQLAKQNSWQTVANMYAQLWQQNKSP